MGYIECSSGGGETVPTFSKEYMYQPYYRASTDYGDCKTYIPTFLYNKLNYSVSIAKGVTYSLTGYKKDGTAITISTGSNIDISEIDYLYAYCKGSGSNPSLRFNLTLIP